MSLIKFLRLQGDDMSAPYDKDFIYNTLSIVSKTVYTHTIFISNNIF